MNKFKSIIKKGVTISKNGLDPYLEGKYNFENPTEYYEKKAKQRKFVCVDLKCKHYKDETADICMVGGLYGPIKEDDIPELTNKMCGKCGCTLSYKLRQNLKPCKKWLKQ